MWKYKHEESTIKRKKSKLNEKDWHETIRLN